MSRVDRWLAFGTPVVAMATVGVGLEIGAGGTVRAATVYGAAPSRGAATAVWQVVASEERGSVREPIAHLGVEVTREGSVGSGWRGTTNDDGVAEALLPTAAGRDGAPAGLVVRSAGEILAQGSPDEPLEVPAAKRGTPWAPFARREGALAIDVAVLGERVAPSFAANVWVRVHDAASKAPAAGVDVTPEGDASLTSFTEHARTDSRGWAELVVVPAGLAVSFAVDAHAADGRTGTWIGGLVASPGAARVGTQARWAPDDEVTIAVVAPPTRTEAYVEIDDAVGRAWATSIALSPASDGTKTGEARAPKLAPGLYWAVAAWDPSDGATLGSGTAARPFFVAKTDEQALSLGPDADACAVPLDAREMRRALESCLAVAVATPTPRWLALDGFASQRVRSAARRSRGLVVALGGVALAVLLEGALLLRAAAGSRLAPESEVVVDRRRWTVLVALLIGLLGFALLAAFLVRMS